MTFGTPYVAVDAAGGNPAAGTVTPSGTGSRVLQAIAGLTLAGDGSTWVHGVTGAVSITDPGASGSCLNLSWDQTPDTAASDWAATIAGSPSASAYVAIPVNGATGTFPPQPHVRQTITGHPFMIIGSLLNAQTPGGTVVLVACTMGATPPTVTDAAGFTVTSIIDPIDIDGAAVLTAWAIDINAIPTDITTKIRFSEYLDSAHAIYLI